MLVFSGNTSTKEQHFSTKNVKFYNTRLNSWTGTIEEEKHSAQLHVSMQVKKSNKVGKDIFKQNSYYATLEEAVQAVAGDDYEQLSITRVF